MKPNPNPNPTLTLTSTPTLTLTSARRHPGRRQGRRAGRRPLGLPAENGGGPRDVFSRVAGAWPLVARLCYSSVYFNSLTRPDIDTRHRAAAEVAQKGSGEVV